MLVNEGPVCVCHVFIAKLFTTAHFSTMDKDELDGGFAEKLGHIEHSWKDALGEIIQPYIDLDREPSEAVLEAFAAVLSCSHNELRRLIGRLASAQGSTLFAQWTTTS